VPRPTLSSVCRLLAHFPILALLLALLLASRPARCDSESDTTQGAIELGRAALAQYERGRWADAYLTFEQAERRAHSPVFTLYMARCKRQTRELLSAKRLYELVTTEQPSPEMPAPWARAVMAAKEELGALALTIPSVCVGKETGSDIVRASLGGHTFSLSGTCQEVEIDPGEHVVLLWDQDGRRRTVELRVSEGQRRVALPRPAEDQQGEAIPERSLEPLRSSSVRPGRGAPPKKSTIREPLGIAALGLGAVGIGIGVVAGIVAAGKADDLHCSNDRCPASEASSLRSASRWAAVSTVGFIFGGASAAAGVLTLIVVPRWTDAAADTSIVVQGKF
jgi:hypothetical protein